MFSEAMRTSYHHFTGTFRLRPKSFASCARCPINGFLALPCALWNLVAFSTAKVCRVIMRRANVQD